MQEKKSPVKRTRRFVSKAPAPITPLRGGSPWIPKPNPTEEPPDLAPSNAFTLPAELRSAGDPVDGNPFPTNHPGHRVWQQATLKAEEELCRLNSEFQKIQPTGNEGCAAWIQKGEPVWTPEAFAAWAIGMTVGKFDIWAKRNIQVVWSEDAVRAYDQWLFDYAQAWIDSEKEAGRLSNSSLLDLRSRLIGRMEWWKAEGRRYLSEQKAHAARSGNPTHAQACEESKREKSRTHPRKSPDQRSSATLTRDMKQLLPRFESGREILRSAQKSHPTDRKSWESALRQAGFVDQSDIDALMSSRNATAATAKVIALKKNLDPRTVQNAFSQSKKSTP